MKIMKKWLAIGLAVAMLTGLSACGNENQDSSRQQESSASEESGKSEESSAPQESSTEEAGGSEAKEPVLLEWYYRGNGQQKDTDRVEDRVNELLKQYPGLEHVSININCFPASEYATQVTTAQASGAQIDILNSVNLDFDRHVEDGSWMPMEDYISDALKTELPEWLWEMGTRNGHVYMVPNYQNAFNANFLFFPKDYMDKYGDYDAMYQVLTDWEGAYSEKVQCLADYVKAVNEGEGGGKYCGNMIQGETGSLGFGYVTPYDNLGNGFVVPDKSNEVKFVYELDGIKDILKGYATWYDMGLYAPDGETTNILDYNHANMMQPTACVFSGKEQVGTPEQVAEIYSSAWGFDVVAIPTQPYNYIQNTWGAGGNGISSTCKNPQEACDFIEALTTGTELGKEIYNTMVFGLEGEHYTRDENDPNRITTLEYDGSQGGSDTSYAGLKWILGNSFYAYKNQAVLDGQFERIKEMNEAPDTVSSSIIGFSVSTANVQTEIDQVVAVVGEYQSSLNSGTLGEEAWDAYYEEFMEKAEKAGLSKIREDFQAQLDEWLAENR